MAVLRTTKATSVQQTLQKRKGKNNCGYMQCKGEEERKKQWRLFARQKRNKLYKRGKEKQ